MTRCPYCHAEEDEPHACNCWGPKAELREALQEVVNVADRNTVEFDRARAALQRADERENEWAEQIADLRAEVEAAETYCKELSPTIATLRAENERLRDERDEWKADADRAADIVRGYHNDMFKLTAENARRREALGFYAEYDNYREGAISGQRLRSEVEIDNGEIARAAIRSNETPPTDEQG